MVADTEYLCQKEVNWRDYHRFTAAQLNYAVRSWLLDTGSLTKRLIKTSNGHFSVTVLQQQWQSPRPSEIALLSMAHRERAIIREVILSCYGQPWVFARSVIPASSLRGSLRRLRKLDNRPLGALLFNDPSMYRHPFQLASITANSPQIPHSLHNEGTLWGRRSRFELAGKPIMVSEIFLPQCRL